MRLVFLLLLFILINIDGGYSQTTMDAIVKLDNNLHSFICKNFYNRIKSLDSVKVDLSSPIKRVEIYCWLNQKNYLGSLNEFENHLGLKPSNSIEILKKFKVASAEQKALLRKKRVIKEYEREDIETRKWLDVLLEWNSENSSFRIPTCFLKCNFANCLNGNERIRLINAPIREYPSDTSKIIYFKTDSTNGLGFSNEAVKTGKLLSSEQKNGFYQVYVDDENKEIQGWVCSCFTEVRPTPFDLLKLADTSYYQSILNDIEWKRRCDTSNYSKKEHAEIYQYLGLSYLEADQFIKSIKYLTEANKLFKSPYVIAKRAIAKFNLGDYRGSVMDLEKLDISTDGYCEGAISTGLFGFILKFDLPNYWLLRLRAKSYINIKIYEKALIDLNSSIRLKKDDNAEAYYLRGVIKFNSGNYNAGCKDFSIAGEQGYEEAYKTINDNCNE